MQMLWSGKTVPCNIFKESRCPEVGVTLTKKSLKFEDGSHLWQIIASCIGLPLRADRFEANSLRSVCASKELYSRPFGVL